MDQYFKKHLNNAFFYAVLFIFMTSSAVLLLTTEGWFTGNLFVFISFFIVLVLVIILYLSIDNYLKFKNRIVIWENIEDFLHLNDQSIYTVLKSKPKPSAGLEYFEYDFILENQGLEVKIKGVSPFYSKKIIDIAEKSHQKLFKMWVRYGPNKYFDFGKELIIEPA